jgi:hypothetical protein
MPTRVVPTAINRAPPWRSTKVPIKGARHAPIMPSPDRNSENTPRETPRSAVSGFRKIASVLASAKEEATLDRKPTPTMYQP